MSMKKYLFVSLLVLLVAAFSSCRSYKDQTGISYLNNLDKEALLSLQTPYNLKIKPDDELQIAISSTIPQATAQYNLPPINYIGRSENQVYTSNAISTYTVTETGEITVPNLGTMKVVGMTPEQLEAVLTEKVKETVNDPVVKVEIRNFKVVVLGEVNSPGTKVFKGRRCSIFDALGEAKDITLTGRRDNIILLREENGVVNTHKIDLTDTNIITSPYYYLQQNDVLIVDATNVRKENSTYNTMNSFRLQMTSTIVSVVSVMASLCISLIFK